MLVISFKEKTYWIWYIRAAFKIRKLFKTGTFVHLVQCTRIFTQTRIEMILKVKFAIRDFYMNRLICIK